MRLLSLIFITIVLMVFSACKKVGIESKSEFAGYWHASIGEGECATIKIDNEGYGVYCIRYNYGYDKYYSGEVMFTDKHIYIDRHNSFDIIEYPHPIDTNIEREYVVNHETHIDKLGNWRMVLYGYKPKSLHICGTWTYYKADY